MLFINKWNYYISLLTLKHIKIYLILKEMLYFTYYNIFILFEFNVIKI